MNPILNIVRRAADEAGKIIRRGFNQLEQIPVQDKGRANLLTSVDLQSEAVIKEILREKYPNYSFLGEESGFEDKNSEYTWLVDPLDGTANFVSGIPYFSVSIALVKNSKVELGLVYNPVTEDIFLASRGEGALYNGKKLRINLQRDAKRALIATGFPVRTPEKLEMQSQKLTQIFQEFADVRCFGATALDLCFVAANRYSGYYEIELEPWDIAAGLIIAQEAGAIITDFSGKSANYTNREIICANQYLHKNLISCLKSS